MPGVLQKVLWHKPNRLVYPGTNPGVDNTHPAAVNLRFSFIAATNFIRIAPTFQAATLAAAAPTFSLDGALGPVGVYAGTENASTAATIAGGFAGTDSAYTIACIFRMTSLAAQSLLFFSSSSSNTYGFNVQSNGSMQVVLPGFTAWGPAAGTVVVNTPYFVAVSGITGQHSIVVINLNTGQMQTATSTTAFTASAENGTLDIGCWNASGGVSTSKIAAGMKSGVMLSLGQLVQWANDPWSFWYPNVISSFPIFFGNPTSTAPLPPDRGLVTDLPLGLRLGIPILDQTWAFGPQNITSIATQILMPQICL